MVRQNALKIRSWADVFGLESGVPTEGWASLVLYYDHINSITRNTQLLQMSLCSYWLPKSDMPEIFRDMTIISFHLNYTKRLQFKHVPLLLRNVAHVPRLNYHLLSLKAIADNGHTYTGTHEGVTVFFSTGDTLFFPSLGRLNFLYAYRPGMLVDETANATIAPRLTLSNRDISVDTNDFHVAHAHAHEGALRKTAKQMGVTPEGKLHECKGCSMEKGIRMSITSKTNSHENKRLSRVFADLGGNKHVASMGENKYPVIVRDDFSRYVWLYFIRHTFDATEEFKQFLADLRVEGIPSEVVVVR